RRSCFIPEQKIECGSERAGSATARIATERAADRAGVRAVLNSKRKHNRGVSGVGIRLRVRSVVREKQLAEATIREPACGRGIAQAINLDPKRRGRASVRKAFASHAAHPGVKGVRRVS